MKSTGQMTRHVDDYLAIRRAFGYQLDIAGEQLHRFAVFADREAAGSPLTIGLALRWAQASSTGKQLTAACRLRTLRPFSRYLKTIEPRTDVVPLKLLGPAQYRRSPYIYTDDEVCALLDAARTLKPVYGLRPHTVGAYLGLLACTGMRPAEPLRLARSDVDLGSRTITLRQTKFSKSRIVVLHSTAAKALEKYVQSRDQAMPHPSSSAFFLWDNLVEFTYGGASRAFDYLIWKLGWRDRRPRPRLYDFRHTFVCRQLLTWYRDGVDVHLMMPVLSTYLGHAQITHTYWYVTAIPELMEIASGRFENGLPPRREKHT